MNKLLGTTFFSLVLIASVFAGTILLEFEAQPSQDRIRLNWKTGEEVNVVLFEIERSNNDRDFLKVGEIAAKGSNSSYEFIDNNLAELKSIFYYRLQIKDVDGSRSQTESISVIPKISSFTRTWGSIKALFQ